VLLDSFKDGVSGGHFDLTTKYRGRRIVLFLTYSLKDSEKGGNSCLSVGSLNGVYPPSPLHSTAVNLIEWRSREEGWICPLLLLIPMFRSSIISRTVKGDVAPDQRPLQGLVEVLVDGDEGCLGGDDVSLSADVNHALSDPHQPSVGARVQDLDHGLRR